MAEHEQSLRRLMEYKTRLEEYEAEIKKTEAKRETLLEQAKQRYGVSSYAELEEHREKVYARFTKAKADADELNAMLEAFFTDV